MRDHCCGDKVYVDGDGEFMVTRGKKGTSGVHIMKTVQAIIVSVYNEPIVAEQCANVKCTCTVVKIVIINVFPTGIKLYNTNVMQCQQCNQSMLCLPSVSARI